MAAVALCCKNTKDAQVSDMVQLILKTGDLHSKDVFELANSNMQRAFQGQLENINDHLTRLVSISADATDLVNEDEEPDEEVVWSTTFFANIAEHLGLEVIQKMVTVAA